MSFAVVIMALLALSRAEILERFKSPVITQAEGLVQVYADCSEDLRREYQMPVASFAAETVKTLYQGLNRKPVRFPKPGIVIHIGDVRTNLTTVAVRVATNESRIVSRIYVPSPGFADLGKLRYEVAKAFFRSVEGREVSETEAVRAYRRADPALRIADERQMLEDWLAGAGGVTNDEEGLKLMRKVIDPGHASKRDVLTFASRLYLYPPLNDQRFFGRFDCISFREAIRFATKEPAIRLLARIKADEMPVFGGGRGEEMSAAAEAYREFLLELAKYEKSEKELCRLLDDADERLNVALERAQ